MEKTVITQQEIDILTALTLLELAMDELQDAVDEALKAIEKGTFLSLN